VLDYDEDDLATMPILVETTLVDSMFSFTDFVIQMFVLNVYMLNILTQEGFIATLSIHSPFYVFLNEQGLISTVCLMAIFIFTHANQSKYIGISNIDSF
jgi:hypothetical protein